LGGVTHIVKRADVGMVEPPLRALAVESLARLRIPAADAGEDLDRDRRLE
jgi:hypothetical protein